MAASKPRHTPFFKPSQMQSFLILAFSIQHLAAAAATAFIVRSTTCTMTGGDASLARSVEVQARIRRDAIERGRALAELREWEASMKQREQQQQAVGLKSEAAAADADENTAPVIDDKRPQKRDERSNGRAFRTNNTASGTSPPFEKGRDEDDCRDKSPSECADEERKRGNDCYARGDFDGAIRCYTASLRFDPHSAVAYSNRAMAHLKKKDWSKAEEDSTTALSLDPTHIKSYQRRAAAASSLGKLRAALVDLDRAQSEATKQDRNNNGDGGENVLPRKDIASEKRRVESLLRAAMKRAPRRHIPVTIISEPENEGIEKKKEGEDEEETVMVVAENGNIAGNDCENKEPPVVDLVAESKQNTDVDDKDGAITSTPLVTKAATRHQYKTPKTWYDFETTWRSLELHQDRSAFLATIKPRRLAALYRHGIDDVEILVSMITAAAILNDEKRGDNGGKAVEYIKCIANTKSIAIPALMMTEEQRVIVRDAISKCFVRSGDKSDDDDSYNHIMSRLGC